MSEMVAASRPICSAQSGTTAWREARTAATRTTPMPTVTKMRMWLDVTERIVGRMCGPPAVPVTVRRRCSPGRSGMVYESTAAISWVATPTQNAPPMPRKGITAAPRNGPMNRPMRITPPSVDKARAR